MRFPNRGHTTNAPSKVCKWCGQPFATGFDYCVPCIERARATAYAQQPETMVAKAIVNRYRDGYRVANTITGFGRTLKIFGWVSGGGILFIGLLLVIGVVSIANPSDRVMGINAEWLLVFIVFLFSGAGVLSGAIFWILGVLVSANGQMLKTQLDSAVHSSPFLTDEQRLPMMSLVG